MVQKNDDVEIEQSEEHVDSFGVRKISLDYLIKRLCLIYFLYQAYYAYESEDQNTKHEPDYSEELGLSIEKLKEGFKLKDLWDIVGS